MKIETLVRMVNDIGAFFTAPSPQAELDQVEAARNIAAHLRRYWDPRMRRQIVEHYLAGGEGLAQAAKSAVALVAGDSQGP